MNIIQAVAEVDELPTIIDSPQIHAIILVRKAYILAILLETISPVFSVCNDSPDIIGIIAAHDAIGVKGNISSDVIKAGFLT